MGAIFATVGQNKTKVGLKGKHIFICGYYYGCQNKTKVGLKGFFIFNIVVCPCASQNKTKVGLKV